MLHLFPCKLHSSKQLSCSCHIPGISGFLQKGYRCILFKESIRIILRHIAQFHIIDCTQLFINLFHKQTFSAAIISDNHLFLLPVKGYVNFFKQDPIVYLQCSLHVFEDTASFWKSIPFKIHINRFFNTVRMGKAFFFQSMLLCLQIFHFSF